MFTNYKVMGFNISDFDYEGQGEKLKEISKYNPWVAACIRVIVSNANKPILKLYNVNTNEDVDKPEYMTLINNPNPFYTYDRLVKQIVYSLLDDGNAYIFKIRASGDYADTKSKITSLMPLKPCLVEPKIENNAVIYEYSKNGQIIRIPESNIIHFKDNDYGDGFLKGTSILKHLLFPVNNDNLINRYNMAMIKNDGMPAGILKTEQILTEETAEKQRKRWQQAHSGDNKGSISILGQGFEWQQTGSSMQDMGYRELKSVSREEIIAIYKVPPVELGLETQNYATAQTQRRLMWESRMIPLLDSIAATLTQGHIKTDYKDNNTAYYYDYTNIQALQDDLQKKAQTGLSLMAMGYTLPEIAELLELPTPTVQPVIQEQPPKNMKSLYISDEDVRAAYRNEKKGEFIKAHKNIETIYETNLSNYFIKTIRNPILDNLSEAMTRKNLDYILQNLEAFIEKNRGDWNETLKEISRRNMLQVGNDMVKSIVEGYKLVYKEGLINIIIAGKKGSQITGVNDTMIDGFKTKINKVLQDAVSQNLTTSGIAEAIRENTKDYFRDMSTYRAHTIARTEISSTANELITVNYKENGVANKEWLSAQDEWVRSFANKAEFDHVAMDGRVVPIDLMFEVPYANGNPEPVLYPADMENGSAGNVINCRCTEMPD